MSPLKFHPRELAFVGYSNSGKTSLLQGVLNQLTHQHKVGIVKHDAHQLELDHPNKDSYKLWHAGASALLIHNSKEQFSRSLDPVSDPMTHFKHCDFVLIEGHKQAAFPKLVILDAKEQVWSDMNDAARQQTLGFIGTRPPTFATSLPWFNRDDHSGISKFILEYFKKQSDVISLKGLVLCGGKSKRMGRDKNYIEYHGQAQYRWAYQQLTDLNLETYLSCREDQNFDLPCLADQLLNMGPMGGILSALHQQPNTAFLTIAIDQPYLSTKTLNKLVEQRDPQAHATCFIDPHSRRPEPLCCIYEPSFTSFGFSAIAQHHYSPKQLLESLRVKKILPDLQDNLTNLNHPVSTATSRS